MLEASILVIGDEILGGFVQDTNSGWLAQRLQQQGVPLTRIQTVPDELADIGEALQAELGRSRPRVIVTSGGIGSTPDDLTYEAVAASLGRGLVEDATMAGRIAGALEWTREQGVDVTEEFTWHMMRMARVPEGSRLLHHRGWAPGIAIDVDGGSNDGGATIVILPGVPSQLRAIFSEAVEPELIAGRNPRPSVRELTHGFPESALNLCFVRVLADHPEVKIGSYPGVPMLIRLSGPEEAVEAAADDVATYLHDLQADPAGARLAAAWADRLGGGERDRR
ncbi:MAG: competence/damage-inducible protein A [Actinobacteria bacterium]|nr:competence/damage-inducible protein A [Actinomycetota bacterium]